jgi:citrate lyase beta subunit
MTATPTTITPTRLPMQVLYGGAHRFDAGAPAKLGRLARGVFERYAHDGDALADALEWTGATRARADDIHARVLNKLVHEPIEDVRIDFEDGYGFRPGDEEDADVARAARELASLVGDDGAPPFIGVRIKSFGGVTRARAQRTLQRFLDELLAASGGALPDGFAVTLPKVSDVEEVRACEAEIAAAESRAGIAAGSIAMELLIETPSAIFDDQGRAAAPALVDAAGGRVRSVHLGAYDYTSSLGILASAQRLDHPACDFARDVTQVALATRGVQLADGATTVLPIGPHRGDQLTDEQRLANRDVVWNAWRRSSADITRAFERGWYHGWDLHPAQLPVRYAATYAAILDGLEPAGVRLRNFVQQAANATLVGDVFDDAATGQGLVNTFLRALQCGAIDDADVERLAGVSVEELRGRSFLEIAEARRARV